MRNFASSHLFLSLIFGLVHCGAGLLLLPSTLAAEIESDKKDQSIRIPAARTKSTAWQTGKGHKQKKKKKYPWQINYRGNLELEGRYFLDPPQYEEQFEGLLGSVAGEFRLDYLSPSRKQQIQFQPFFRLDSVDPYRQYIDLEELHYLHILGDWEFLLGVHRVFWGVTESYHLVDIINQSQLADDVFQEQKLGQTMARMAYSSDFGTFELYALGFFRERVYPGEMGRLRGGLAIGSLETVYTQEQILEGAMRWSHSLGQFDLGISHFYGISREPLIIEAGSVADVVAIDPEILDNDLVVFYDHISQTGIDLQLTLGDWLIKSESIFRRGEVHILHDYYATVSGVEWVQGNLFASGIDAHFFAEYLFDERGDEATTIFENDFFLGVALNFNNPQGTEFSLGTTIDRNYEEKVGIMKWSRRFGESFKLQLKGLYFSKIDKREYGKLLSLSNDSHGSAAIIYNF